MGIIVIYYLFLEIIVKMEDFNKYKHLHFYNTTVEAIILDEYYKSYGEGEKDYTRIKRR